VTLAAGTRLGPYEITASIGAGGMGEVYRARDSRLNRDVAVKVLPAAIANDADLRARFEREAQAVAALSHPNILAIFDVGRDGETVFFGFGHRHAHVPARRRRAEPVRVVRSQGHDAPYGWAGRRVLLSDALARRIEGGVHAPGRSTRRRHLDARSCTADAVAFYVRSHVRDLPGVGARRDARLRVDERRDFHEERRRHRRRDARARHDIEPDPDAGRDESQATAVFCRFRHGHRVRRLPASARRLEKREADARDSDACDRRRAGVLNGKWIAYASTETGGYDVFVQHYPTTGARWQISTGGGRQPRWSAKGDELYFVTNDRKFYAVAVHAGASFEFSTPTYLFDMPTNTISVRNSYVPSRDGQRFLVNMLLDTIVPPIYVDTDWASNLQR